MYVSRNMIDPLFVSMFVGVPGVFKNIPGHGPLREHKDFSHIHTLTHFRRDGLKNLPNGKANLRVSVEIGYFHELKQLCFSY